MKARHQYRFYPTDQQRQSLAQLFGCVRVVWNDGLAFCKQSEKLPGYNKLSSLLTQAKKTDARKWLADVSAVRCSNLLDIWIRLTKTFSVPVTGNERITK